MRSGSALTIRPESGHSTAALGADFAGVCSGWKAVLASVLLHPRRAACGARAIDTADLVQPLRQAESSVRRSFGKVEEGREMSVVIPGRVVELTKDFELRFPRCRK